MHRRSKEKVDDDIPARPDPPAVSPSSSAPRHGRNGGGWNSGTSRSSRGGIGGFVPSQSAAGGVRRPYNLGDWTKIDSLAADLYPVIKAVRYLFHALVSNPANLLFAVGWVWALRSWHHRFAYGSPYTSIPSRGGRGRRLGGTSGAGAGAVAGAAPDGRNVIAYSLYLENTYGDFHYDYDGFGGGDGGGGEDGFWNDHVGGMSSSSSSSNSRYYDGVIANAELLPQVYPGWTMRIYHDDTAPAELLDILRKKSGVVLVDVKHTVGKSGVVDLSNISNKMMWRFAVASDPTVERYCIRDVDSRLGDRERYAVDEWIESGRKFHVIRDHPSHGNFVMSGGLWCGTADAVPDMVKRIRNFQSQAESTFETSGYMKDMDFLRDEIWPLAKHSMLHHDSFTCNNYNDARGFPSLRRGGEHVGSVFVNGKIRQDDVDILQAAIRSERQPSQCRDRNEVEAKATLSDPPGLHYWKPTSPSSAAVKSEANRAPMMTAGAMGNMNGGAWNDHELDEGYDQIQNEFERTANRNKQQDLDKPIANIGGRTCFKYDSSGPIPERKGQITSDTTFGAALRNVARRPDVKRIIETGTWFGGGSTHEFAEGLKDKSNCATNSTHHCCEAFVVSFELFEPALEHARLYHQDNPVWIVKGSAVGVDQMAKESDIPDEERNGEHFQLYYERDRELMSKAMPKLEKFCKFIRPDVVLVDGNEYTGWAEFKVAMNMCRPRYIALHDTGTFKTKKVEKFIHNKKPDLFELVDSGQDAASWSIYRFKQPDVIDENGFRIIVLTQKRHWSLDRLLKSIDRTEFGGAKVELEIRIDYDTEESDDYHKTVEVAQNFRFSRGTVHIHKYTRNEGLQLAWLNAWKPSSDDERAVILEDDLELSPLWFIWLKKAWNAYGGRSDLGGISLCRQRMRASDSQHIMVDRDEPFLYRLPGSFGFSPNARYWRQFINWVRTTDVQHADLYVPGTITSDWYRNSPDFWEQVWIWWSWSNGRSLYTLYAHSRNGALVGHWAEPGVHADADNEAGLERNDELLQSMEPLLEAFPPDLVKFGWNFEIELGGWDEPNDLPDFSSHKFDGNEGDDVFFHEEEQDHGLSPNTYGSGEVADDLSGSKLTVWTNDFHIATVANVKSLLQTKGVRFIDKSLSGHCHETNTCAHDLKVLTPDNAMTPDSFTRDRFLDAYRDDQEMAKVDIVMCFHPSAMCELFMPLKKRLFVIASTRYELGRESASEWEKWNENLLQIAKEPGNLVAANNLYDCKYIEYFTGIKPVLLPSWIKMDESDIYTGMSEDILIAPIHTSNAEKIETKLKSISSRFRSIGEKYGHYTFSQLAENSAIIHIPYQVSIMSLFEQYAMGIPILAPTPAFLWELHEKLDVMNERTWEQIRMGRRPSGSPISGLKKGQHGGHDPNNDTGREAFLHWVQYADFYQWPHIIHFNSWKDLRRKLEETDFEVVSDEMLGFVKRAIDKTSAEWTKILDQTDNYAPDTGTGTTEEGPASDLATYLSEFMQSVHLW